MADVVTTAFTIIFIGILLLIGVVIFGTIADPMGDQFYPNESVIAYGCSDPYNVSGSTYACSGTVAHPSIENTTRAAPVGYNCTATKTDCQIMTYGTHFNVTTSTGLIYIEDDDYNGTIYISYWSDTATASADLAQQSMTGTIYGGFDLATVMVIVMAAVGVISAVFLIGRKGA